MLKVRHTLSLVVTGDTPPSEFQIFAAGPNETKKGTFVFDAVAAKSVMAEFAKHGIDLMIDYDHASLASVTLDPAQTGKAAGWFQLEVRGGALWAVNVRWTPPAAAALSAKEWRFMSPAFATDDGRITSLLNVAITNLPATRNLKPLMAASSGGDSSMTIEEFQKVCKALGIDPTMSLDDALAKIKGTGGDDAPPSSADGGPADSSATPPVAAGAAPPPAPPAPEDDKKKDAAVAASAVRLLSMTGAKSFVDAVEVVATYRASHIELETERTKLASERAVLESAERRKLCVELVTCGAEFPSTVWAVDKATTIKSRWLKMDLTELRSHVADQRAARGGKKDPKAPAGQTAPEHHGLSTRELAVCVELKCSPADYAALKAFRDSGKPEGV